MHVYVSAINPIIYSKKKENKKIRKTTTTKTIKYKNQHKMLLACARTRIIARFSTFNDKFKKYMCVKRGRVVFVVVVVVDWIERCVRGFCLIYKYD